MTRETLSPEPELVVTVYEELRRLAHRALKAQRPGHSLQPTDLAHMAYEKLARHPKVRWAGPTHFKRVAARAMQQVLCDHARGKGAKKRGRRVALDSRPLTTRPHQKGGMRVDVIDLHVAIQRLRELHSRQADVVELRYFGGMTIDETAHALGVGTTTVENDWDFARSWLQRELTDPRGGGDDDRTESGDTSR